MLLGSKISRDGEDQLSVQSDLRSTESRAGKEVSVRNFGGDSLESSSGVGINGRGIDEEGRLSSSSNAVVRRKEKEGGQTKEELSRARRSRRSEEGRRKGRRGGYVTLTRRSREEPSCSAVQRRAQQRSPRERDPNRWR